MKDASAAKGIAMRVGLGKLKHVDISQLWVQEKVRSGEVEIVKVGTHENIADTLTKYVNNQKRDPKYFFTCLSFRLLSVGRMGR